jgi:hypothetical protein
LLYGEFCLASAFYFKNALTLGCSSHTYNTTDLK